MSILSGYKKFKKYIKTSSGFQLQSLWTSANTVEADDKRTIQTKVGAINGISSSETANSAEIAASTALTNKMNGTINNLSRDLGGCKFGITDDGLPGYKKDGADTVIPFRRDWEMVLKITFGANASSGEWKGYPTPTDDPGGWFTSIETTVTCINGQITLSNYTGIARRFNNQSTVIAGFISNITVVKFEYKS